MTRLLVSVRSYEEAADALEGGAQLIDVKDPTAGSLGAASPEVMADVVRLVNDRVEVSAALGELSQGQPAVRAALVPSGVRYIKYGLSGWPSGAPWAERWQSALARLPPRAAGVAVVYADWKKVQAPEPNAVLLRARSQGCPFVLIDTFDKSQGNLTSVWPVAEMTKFVSEIRRAGLRIVLAGSLRLEDLPMIAPLRADFVAVRGAVCRGSRNGPLDPQRVRLWRDRLSRFG